MFVGLADRGHRKHKRRTVLRHQLDRAGHDACVDRGIDPNRQMWAVLFDRPDGKHRDGPLAVEPRKIDCSQIPPPTRDHTEAEPLVTLA
jgi:hypothetical protein